MVTRADIQRLADDIARAFPEVESIILFGSHAYGTPREDSDVDLLVLAPTANDHQYAQAVREYLHDHGQRRVDVIVRDPDHARRRYGWYDPLVRDAFDRGMHVYERSRARVA